MTQEELKALGLPTDQERREISNRIYKKAISNGMREDALTWHTWKRAIDTYAVETNKEVSSRIKEVAIEFAEWISWNYTDLWPDMTSMEKGTWRKPGRNNFIAFSTEELFSIYLKEKLKTDNQ